MLGRRREEALYWLGRLREFGGVFDVEFWLRQRGRDYEKKHGTSRYQLLPVVPLEDIMAVAEPGEIRFEPEHDKFRYCPRRADYGRDNRKLPFPKEARA